MRACSVPFASRKCTSSTVSEVVSPSWEETIARGPGGRRSIGSAGGAGGGGGGGGAPPQPMSPMSNAARAFTPPWWAADACAATGTTSRHPKSSTEQTMATASTTARGGADETKRKPFARYLPTVGRVLLGLVFLVFGLNGFLQFLPQPSAPPPAGALAF